MDTVEFKSAPFRKKASFFALLICLFVFLSLEGAVLDAAEQSDTTVPLPETEVTPDISVNEESFEFQEGRKLYFGLCAPCHGGLGDGKGFGRALTRPRARDFTSGIFKYRSTPSGQPPTDNDLVKVIKQGNPGTAMPAYGDRLSDDEARYIIQYIKEKIAPEVFKMELTPYTIGDPPEATPELIAQGRTIYAKGDCGDCHGKYARGDGTLGWQETMADVWGDRIYPTNLTYPWEMRNFSTLQDLYRSLITGLDGTPMQSYRSLYSDDEIWALAHYLKSVQITRVFKNPLPVEKVSNIPASVDDALWDTAEFTDVFMQGKKSFGQTLVARVNNVRMRAVHSGSEIALLLEWSDKKPDRGSNKQPPDTVNISFPSVIIASDPWVDKGDRRSTLDVWKWNAADNRAVEAYRKGSHQSEKKKTRVRSVSRYEDGQYRIMFIRDIKGKATDDITFKKGEFILYSITVNDGDNLEKGDRGGKSGYHKIVLR